MIGFRVWDTVRVRVRVRVADCCIQTAGESDKMRINHVIKTDQWRATPQIRILSSPGTNITVRSVNVVITVIVWRQTHTIEIVCSDDVTSRIMEN